jgi:hypothetical protein
VLLALLWQLVALLSVAHEILLLILHSLPLWLGDLPREL